MNFERSDLTCYDTYAFGYHFEDKYSVLFRYFDSEEETAEFAVVRWLKKDDKRGFAFPVKQMKKGKSWGEGETYHPNYTKRHAGGVVEARDQVFKYGDTQYHRKRVREAFTALLGERNKFDKKMKKREKSPPSAYSKKQAQARRERERHAKWLAKEEEKLARSMMTAIKKPDTFLAPNLYEGKCAYCECDVPARGGRREKFQGKWIIACPECLEDARS